MSGEPQTVFCGIGIDVAKQLWTGLGLVSANPESHDVSRFVTSRQFGYDLRFIRSELTHGVEDPQQRDSKVTFTPLPPALQTFEYCHEVLLAPQTHAHRHINL